MSPPIPKSEPPSVNAGDTARWLKALADYPASEGWDLSYTLINTAGKIEFSATAEGDAHRVEVPATETAVWGAGDYAWRASVSKAGQVFTVATGRIIILAAFTAPTLDARSRAARTLEAIDSTLEGRASSATAEYEIAGRKLKYIPIPELLQLRDRLRRDVREEAAAAAIGAGLANPGRIYVRFGA